MHPAVKGSHPLDLERRRRTSIRISRENSTAPSSGRRRPRHRGASSGRTSSAAKRGLALTVSAVLALTVVAVTPTPSDAQVTEYVEFNFLNSAWIPSGCTQVGTTTNCRIDRVGTGDLAFPDPNFTGAAAGRLRLDAWLESPVFLSAVPVDGNVVGRGGLTVTWPTGNPTYTARIVGDMTLDPNGGTFVEQTGFVPNSSQSRTQTSAIDGNGRLVITDLWNRTAVDLEVPHRPGWAFRGWEVPVIGQTWGPQLVQSGSITVQNANYPQAGATLMARWEQFPDSPTLGSASLSADRRTVMLEFDADMGSVVTFPASCARLFAFESTDVTFGIRDAGVDGAPWTCTIAGSTVQITPHLAYDLTPGSGFPPIPHPGLAASVTSLRVAYIGGNNTLRPAVNPSSRMHHSEFISVSGVAPTAASSGGRSSLSPSWVPTPAGGEPRIEPARGELQHDGGQPARLAPRGVGSGTLAYTHAGERMLARITGDRTSTSTRGVVAAPDATVHAAVCAPMGPGSVVEVWGFAPARLTAAAVVDADGCIDLLVPMAAPLDGGPSFAYGQHTLQFVLPMSGGQGRMAFNVGVTVGGPVPTGVPAGEGPVPMPLALLLAALVAVAGAVLVGRRTLEVG